MKIKLIVAFITLLAAGIGSWIVNSGQAAVAASTESFATIMDLAKAGDYQAQRNVAYGFSAHPYAGQQKNRVLGCAWYLVVLNSGSPKIDATDQSNANVYCGELEPDLLNAAKYNAQRLVAEIYPQR